MEKELWQPVKGFEDYYEISTQGRLKSLRSGKILKPRKQNQGYFSYVLSVKQKYTYRLAHVLVAEAFIPNPENKRTVNHKDSDKHNNRVDNLEWMTHSENHQHAFQNGRENPNAFELGINKLSRQSVEYIRQHYIKGDRTYGAGPLARQFGISTPSLLKVIRRQSYKSVL